MVAHSYFNMLVDSTQDNGSIGSDQVDSTTDLTNLEEYQSQEWVTRHNGKQ